MESYLILIDIVLEEISSKHAISEISIFILLLCYVPGWVSSLSMVDYWDLYRPNLKYFTMYLLLQQFLPTFLEF